MKSIHKFIAVIVLSVLSSIANAAAVPAMKKVMIVIFENTDYKDALNQNFMGRLASEGALLTNMSAEVHPSQANYIALTSGSLGGVSGDSPQNVNQTNIVDLLERKGLTWKAYAEGWPGNCFKGAKSGQYVRKHNPFISYINIQNNPARCSRIVDATELDADIATGQIPDFSIYIPDMRNDGHDTDVTFADRWYERAFGNRIKDDHFMEGMTLITTFDESGSFFGNNHIYTSFYGPLVKSGAQSNAAYNHYNLLKTIEVGLGIGDLGRNDKTAVPILGIWQERNYGRRKN